MIKNKSVQKDSLGDRMKKYEDITRIYLLPRSYTLLRCDGRAFHSYLRGCERPFDKGIIEDMDSTAIYLCENIQNAKLGYVQSDEITILLCDFDSIETSQFFDGNIQKISSIVASMATAKFNQCRMIRQLNAYTKDAQPYEYEKLLAQFDCRVWTVPSRWEAVNAFIWRNQDCSRNSVSMVAQSLYSHNQLHGKSTKDMHEMIHQAGKNWATDYTDGEKNGRLIVKEEYFAPVKEWRDIALFNPNVSRTRWVSKGAWKFTENKEKLLAMIPQYPV